MIFVFIIYAFAGKFSKSRAKQTTSSKIILTIQLSDVKLIDRQKDSHYTAVAAHQMLRAGNKVTLPPMPTAISSLLDNQFFVNSIFF